MADILAQLGVDLTEYRAGLREARREGQAWASGMEQTLGSIRTGIGFAKLAITGGFIAKAFREATEAVREFAKYNEEAARTMELADASASRLKAAIGEVLHPLYSRTIEIADAIFGGVGAAHVADANSLKDFVDLQKQITEEKKKQADIDRSNAAFRREIGFERLQMGILGLELDGDKRTASMFRAALPFDRRIAETLADTTLTQAQRDSRVATLTQYSTAATAFAASEYDQRQLEEDRRRREAVRAVFRDAAFDSQATRANLLELNGFGAEAASAMIAMKFAREMAKITENGDLSAQNKAGLIASLAVDQDSLLTATAAAEVRDAQEAVDRITGRRGSARSLSAGIGGGLALQGIMGSGTYAAPANDPLLRAQERLEKAQKEQTRVLEAIRDNTARSPVAVAG